MDLTRIEGTFTAPKETVTIIGCGAIGSAVAIQLARLGCTQFALYDFDKVESHNIANQSYDTEQITMFKVDALSQLIKRINSRATVKAHKDLKDVLLKKEENLNGYVFLAPDKVSVRKHILLSNKTNPNVLGWFDCRTELFAIQSFVSDHTAKGIARLLDTLNFTDEEAEAALPRSESGCHAKQASGITSTLGGVVLAKLFVDYVKNNKIRKFTRVDLDNFDIDSYS